MWSFVVSIVVFLSFVGGLGLWQRAARRALREQTDATERQIARAAEVAQRRHQRRYGGTHPDLAKLGSHATNGISK